MNYNRFKNFYKETKTGNRNQTKKIIGFSNLTSLFLIEQSFENIIEYLIRKQQPTLPYWLLAEYNNHVRLVECNHVDLVEKNRIALIKSRNLFHLVQTNLGNCFNEIFSHLSVINAA